MATEAPVLATPARRFGEASLILQVLKRDRLALMGVSIIVVAILVGLLAPWIVPFPAHGEGKYEADPAEVLQPPSLEHPFGTDVFGRDVFSRVIYGARISIGVGFAVVALAIVIGAPLGLVAGYIGGRTAEALMRITDMFIAFPPLLLALVIVATLGRGIEWVVFALAISWWPWYTRLMYSQARSLRSQPFVEAARSLGLSRARILWRHILPNAIAPVLVQGTLDLGTAILEAAALSFLGLGARPPTSEWGLMISEGRVNFLNFPWEAAFPGLALVLVVLAFNLFGDGLREAVDPKLRMRKVL
jgi:peptide/nickel transport system permease protein